MKRSLTARILLNFVLLSAGLLATVGALSYRSGSNSLQADARAEMLANAVEKEAALDAWIAERLSDIGEIAGHTAVPGCGFRHRPDVPAGNRRREAAATRSRARLCHSLLVKPFGKT